METDRAFVFHTSTPCGKTFSFVARLMSSVHLKVKYQVHILNKKKSPNYN